MISSLRKMALTVGLAFASLGAHGATAAELVMVEEHGCAWCAKWNREIAPIYPKTEEGRAAPLTRMDISEARSADTFARPVVFTPTFVLVHEGQELGRIEGYPGEDFFWGLLARLIEAELPPDATNQDLVN